MMEAFSIVAALATAVQAAALIMLHLLPTGYNPVRDAVSDLARISGSSLSVVPVSRDFAMAVNLATRSPAAASWVIPSASTIPGLAQGSRATSQRNAGSP